MPNQLNEEMEKTATSLWCFVRSLKEYELDYKRYKKKVEGRGPLTISKLIELKKDPFHREIYQRWGCYFLFNPTLAENDCLPVNFFHEVVDVITECAWGAPVRYSDKKYYDVTSKVWVDRRRNKSRYFFVSVDALASRQRILRGVKHLLEDFRKRNGIIERRTILSNVKNLYMANVYHSLGKSPQQIQKLIFKKGTVDSFESHRKATERLLKRIPLFRIDK